MVKLLKILLISVLFLGCDGKSELKTEQTKSGGELIHLVGGFESREDINEFEYKGYTYLQTRVNGGSSIAHAGHCVCNQ